MKSVRFIIVSLFVMSTIFAQDSSQTFLSLRNTGVEAFQNAHPEYDGRGTIVLVLDTGVDMGVEGLITTSTGEVKVIDVQDFTGQGDTPFFEAEIEEVEDIIIRFYNRLSDYYFQITRMLASLGGVEQEPWKP